mgnify:FL=1
MEYSYQALSFIVELSSGLNVDFAVSELSVMLTFVVQRTRRIKEE